MTQSASDLVWNATLARSDAQDWLAEEDAWLREALDAPANNPGAVSLFVGRHLRLGRPSADFLAMADAWVATLDHHAADLIESHVLTNAEQALGRVRAWVAANTSLAEILRARWNMQTPVELSTDEADETLDDKVDNLDGLQLVCLRDDMESHFVTLSKLALAKPDDEYYWHRERRAFAGIRDVDEIAETLLPAMLGTVRLEDCGRWLRGVGHSSSESGWWARLVGSALGAHRFLSEVVRPRLHAERPQAPTALSTRKRVVVPLRGPAPTMLLAADGGGEDDDPLCDEETIEWPEILDGIEVRVGQVVLPNKAVALGLRVSSRNAEGSGDFRNDGMVVVRDANGVLAQPLKGIGHRYKDSYFAAFGEDRLDLEVCGQRIIIAGERL